MHRFTDFSEINELAETHEDGEFGKLVAKAYGKKLAEDVARFCQTIEVCFVDRLSKSFVPGDPSRPDKDYPALTVRANGYDADDEMWDGMLVPLVAYSAADISAKVVIDVSDGDEGDAGRIEAAAEFFDSIARAIRSHKQ